MAHLKEDDTQAVQVHLLCVVGERGGGERGRGRRGKEGGEWLGEERSQSRRLTGVYLTCSLSSSGATYIAVPTRPVSPAHYE